jgi:uncharacterized protein (TIGR02996 family)
MSERAPDWLVLDGRRRMLVSQPLDPYLRELPNPPDFRIDDGVNARGYVATWEVRPDDTLWLTGLQTRPADDGPDPGLHLLFPNATGPVAATWVAQRLRSPDGELRYDHRGYSPSYAREVVLTVIHGRVVVIEELRGGTGWRSSERITTQLEAIFGADEGAFLRAVRAAPNDSAPRLVYADWLEERGDPRAQAIRFAERSRNLDPTEVVNELARHADIIGPGLRHSLWVQLMGYDELAVSPR